jgi:HK97 family phage prohead protease
MSAPIIHKSFSAETKVLDAGRGLVDAVFSVTGNLDRQNDVITPGAFGKALANKASVPVVYAHDWNNLDAVLGKTVAWAELMPGDNRLPSSLLGAGYGGVKATIQFDQETPAGRLALTHVKNGNLSEWSFAFTAEDDTDAKGVRHLKTVNEIFEVTLALVGANPETVTMALKAHNPAKTRASNDAEIAALLAATAALLAD